MIDLAIGMTGGGTKTTGYLVEGGRLASDAITSGPSNPRRAEFSVAVNHLVRVATELRGSADRGRGRSPGFVAIGLAGAGDDAVRVRVRLAIEDRLQLPVHICTDAEAALAATSPGGPAAILIAGTGSIAMCRDERGRVRRLGGDNPPGGDPGSATAIGHRALESKTDPALAAALAAAGPFAQPAEAAVVVDRLAESGCVAAQGLLDAAAANLVELVERLIGAESRSGEELRLGLVGGVIEESRRVRESFLRGLAGRLPGVAAGPPEQPPELGAVTVFCRDAP